MHIEELGHKKLSICNQPYLKKKSKIWLGVLYITYVMTLVSAEAKAL